MIKINNVYKSFGNLHVLKDLNLDVEKGEVTVICGPSGSGKSTLLRCINGLEDIQQGHIEVDGLPVIKQNFREVRKSIGMVFQSFNLFPHKTVMENITLSPLKVNKLKASEAKSKAMDLLEKVSLSDKADEYPFSLSGGQRQRVAIARALAMNPKAILFDEPTSALDPERIADVLEVMRELALEGMTMIVVTHEMGFAKEVANTVCLMDFGTIIEKADPVSFYKNPQHERTKEFLDQIISHH